MSLLALLFAGATIFFPEDTTAVKYSREIKSSDMEVYLKVLASREFEGRETGERGQKLAAAYLAKSFMENGVKGAINDTGYFQKYPIVLQEPKGIEIKAGKKKFTFLKDFYFFPGFPDTELESDSVLFLGYGIDDENYSDYKKTTATGQIAVIMEGEPVDKAGKSLVSGSKEQSDWAGAWRLKSEAALKNNVKAVFIITENFEKKLESSKHHIENPKAKLEGSKKEKPSVPYIYISPKMAEKILGKSIKYLKQENFKNGQVHFKVKRDIEISVKRPVRKLEAENVLAFIPGSTHKNEVIVLSAHYDHLGKKDTVIFFGADDDGSGTTALLSISKAFSKAYQEGKGPKRSILFLALSGEEKGLLGSDYYTTNPVFPLRNTVADLNIDMIGRRDKKYADDPDYIYVIGSDKISTELHKISEETNKKYSDLKLDYTYNVPNDPNRFYYRSDHYNFAKNNIPVIFYFNGVHEDYHKPTDTVDKIEFSKMEKVSKLIFFTAWELANRKERITIDRRGNKE